jgi:hypothetical protein
MGVRVREETDDVTEWCGEWAGVMGLPVYIRGDARSDIRGERKWGL